MEAKDDFTLHWCEKHKNWWHYNCPDCMADANEEDIKRAGIREVVEWIEEHRCVPLELDVMVLKEEWQAKLKEWGI